MALLKWRDDYSIGVAQIDNEHRQLFDVINEFHDQKQGAVASHDILQMLNKLIQYSESHFRNEEGIMRSMDYADVDQHHQQHDALVGAIFDLAAEVEAGKGTVDLSLHTFLKNWLLDHILQHDMAFADELHKREAAAAPSAAPKLTDSPQ